jgi:hypothetical protein
MPYTKTSKRSTNTARCYTCGSIFDLDSLNTCTKCDECYCDACATTHTPVSPCRCGVDDIVHATVLGCSTFSYEDGSYF